MKNGIIKPNEKDLGLDFIISLDKNKNNTPIKLLQLTDMQFIDSLQRRTPDRIRIDEINAWKPQNFDKLCGNHIKSLIAQSEPDFIFITGDMVYGSFDDNGSMLKMFCDFMDQFEIPWAPVFGNHDNESKIGVKKQCEIIEQSKYSVFKRGNVSGNSNYSIGFYVDDKPVRILHMIDSNGCDDCSDEDVIRKKGIFTDQAEMIRNNTRLISKKYNCDTPAFIAFHIPVEEFKEAEIAKGYRTNDREFFEIGVDVPSKDGDFGFDLERYNTIKTEFDFTDFLKDCNIDGVFVGHCHSICTVIDYNEIKWVFGLKTGQYDYHIPGQLGGTLVTVNENNFEVKHLPALVKYAPFPGGANMFNDFFAEDKVVID